MAEMTNFILAEIAKYDPSITEEEAIGIAKQIIFHNLPICLAKFFNGQEWRLK